MYNTFVKVAIFLTVGCTILVRFSKVSKINSYSQRALPLRASHIGYRVHRFPVHSRCWKYWAEMKLVQAQLWVFFAELPKNMAKRTKARSLLWTSTWFSSSSSCKWYDQFNETWGEVTNKKLHWPLCDKALNAVHSVIASYSSLGVGFHRVPV